MTPTPLPVIHKAPLEDLSIHVARSGIAPGDAAEAWPMADGTIAVIARIRAPLLGIIPWRRRRIIGQFGEAATLQLMPELDRGEELRLRVVGVTPEFLAGPAGAEVSVSVWVRR